MGNEVNNDAMDHDGMEHDAHAPPGRDHEGQGT
jgi:hypothetical protein